jgi:hypothetical protein
MQFNHHAAITPVTDELYLQHHQSHVRRITDEYGTTIALVLSNPDREIESQQEGEQSQGERIALLLAAAPALLAALLECVTGPNSHAFASDDVEKLKQRLRAINLIATDAIAKTVN